MKQSRVMIDGSRVGTRLLSGGGSTGTGSKKAEDSGEYAEGEGEIDQNVRSSIGLMGEEGNRIKKILQLATGREVNNGELSVNIGGKGKSIVRMTLRQDFRDKKMWYLNLDGNPLKFITGQNVYGRPEADTQIVKVFRSCIKVLETETGLRFPVRIKKEVESKNIHVNNLEFAAYSPPLTNKKKVINAWSYMFRRANVLAKESGLNRSLSEILGLRMLDNDGYEDTVFGFATLNSARQKEIMFTVYDKEVEIDSKKKKDGDAVECDLVVDREHDRPRGASKEAREDIKNRLRFDIALTSIWFNSRKIKTLAELENYVQRKFNGDWVALVQAEVQRVMERACLIEMWSVDRDAVLDAADKGLITVPGLNKKIPTTVWLAMLEARSEIGIDDRMKANKLSRDPKRRIQYLRWLEENTEILTLDEKEVRRLRVTRNVKVSQ